MYVCVCERESHIFLCAILDTNRVLYKGVLPRKGSSGKNPNKERVLLKKSSAEIELFVVCFSYSLYTVCCSVLQCVAVCCSVLQCVAVSHIHYICILVHR